MILEGGLELLQGPVLGRLGHSPESIDLGTRVPEGDLAADDGGHIIGGVQHDLAEEHVLQGEDGDGVVLGGKALKSLEKVRVRRLKVLLLRVKNSGLDIKRGLEEGRAVDGVCGGAGRGEGGLGLGDVAELEADLGFEELHLNEEHLVIKPLQFGQKGANELERLGKLPVVEVEGDKPGLQGLAKVDPLLLRGPDDTLLTELNLQVLGSRDLGEEVNQGSHY